ncbi:MAG: hypothetical protein JWP26_2094 [Devosia sp.]|uniref:hypothetical protein n=1 Tax=Devosia sp. TaxID=1871048 RepID=UPI0026163FE6|nr:hypothetical protein [Devosia sp.]MDB5587124.1 hypothetical protein [Devosia sp.]
MKLPLVGLMLGLMAAHPAMAAPPALLQPAARLDAETLEAARFDWKSSGLSYVGVWADTPLDCAIIQTDMPYDGFVIMTPTHLRSYGSYCSTGPALSTPHGFSLTAMCEDEGEHAEATFSVRVIDSETINIDDAEGDLVRCHLPD